jgi:phage terminase small subunit
MALTGKKRAFADAVLAGFSNKEAAIRAGFSEKTASAAGSRNVKDPDVKAYLDQRRQPTSLAGTKAPATPIPVDDAIEIPPTADPVEFLTKVMNEPAVDLRLRIDVAKAMLPFKHQKLGEGGKKIRKKSRRARLGLENSAHPSHRSWQRQTVRGVMPGWTTACPDWAERLRSGRSIIPPPIFPEEAEANLEVMRELRIVDAPGSPRIGEASGQWVFDLAA